MLLCTHARYTEVGSLLMMLSISFASHESLLGFPYLSSPTTAYLLPAYVQLSSVVYDRVYGMI